jgi:serine/threonine protein kinase
LGTAVIGQKINNYEVTALLGTGGMGAVYMARHPLIDRRVAVKVLKPEYARDHVLVQRVFNEAKATNAIRHPNIVDVLDVGVLPDGLPYIIMELLEGESLAHRISRLGRLPIEEAVSIARETASALAAAHAKGIVHRDLKPDNIFLAADHGGRELRVKVLDFGIAKLRREMSAGSYETGAGAILGTPPYMSPEQCQGVSARIDHRADIYALGIILFEMLTGRPPFDAEGVGNVMMMHMSEPPRPPRELNPAIPGALEEIILKTLAKAREDRPQTMEELQELLGGPQRLPASGISPVISAPLPGGGGGAQTLPAVGRLGETILLPASVTTEHPPPAPARTTTLSRRTVTVLVGGGAGIGVVAGMLALLFRPATTPPSDREEGRPALRPRPAVTAPPPEPPPEVTPEWPPPQHEPEPAPPPRPDPLQGRPPVVRKSPARRVGSASSGKTHAPAGASPVTPPPPPAPKRMRKW